MPRCPVDETTCGTGPKTRPGVAGRMGKAKTSLGKRTDGFGENAYANNEDGEIA